MGVDPRSRLEEPEHGIESSLECSPDLPYATPHHRRILGGDVHHFTACHRSQIVGHAILNVAGDCAGLYDMGVLEQARRRGYGLALTLAALARARDEGCTSVTLNATGEGEPVYRRAGFESLGRGMTWWLTPQRR